MHPSTYKAKAYSAASETASLASTTIARRDPTERDVQIEILFCGICHSDLHSVRNEWSEFMHAVGGLALFRAQRLARVADVSGAMSLEALKGH